MIEAILDLLFSLGIIAAFVVFALFVWERLDS